MRKIHELSNFIWSIADLLRDAYRLSQYERVLLPLVVLRRFDCVLESTKEAVLASYTQYKGKLNDEVLDSLLNNVSGQRLHNHSPLSFKKMKDDPYNVHLNLISYINGFSKNVREIFERFDFEHEIERMHECNILFLVIKKFCEVDLHPRAVDNIEMGELFENLIRRFNEQANATAGDHHSPRDVIRLMVNLIFVQDVDLLTKPHMACKILDPTCGTGGMLFEARKYLQQHNLGAKLYVYGQSLNPHSYAIAASDLLLRTGLEENDTSTIKFGDTLVDDQFQGECFDYFLASPPFGMDWRRQQKEVIHEHEQQGFSGRFGAGTPRVNDGALLFLQHMVSKFKPVDATKKVEGSRLAIVFNGSPLFTGGAGSGESEIRRWIIENDWLEAIVAMPEQMFYNTGIGTYVWIVTNRKEPRRQGKIQLIDGRDRWQSLRRSLGDKRREFSDAHITEITQEYGSMHDGATSKVFDNVDFGYNRLTVERPLRLAFQITLERKERFLDACPDLLEDLHAIDLRIGRETSQNWNVTWKQVLGILKSRGSKWRVAQVKAFRETFTDIDPKAEAVIAKKTGGKIEYEANPKLRDFENVPLKEDIEVYFEREVRPHAPDAWIDQGKTKAGYEINFNRYFYHFTATRPLSEIDADLKRAEKEIIRLFREVTQEKGT
ncbi:MULTISPECIES: type I restriction-modification system subunit M [Pseudomonas putida group]|uniref:type I restriction-modification system subunit M n=1 Tax=Pseudomonas putida group TaxID=136845 RepID=UPI0022408885|nr:class I SAM-dependent DNA methyltransferase [Pseudomonas putida]UZM92613.1 type I restriction-modification system subunit M [Pseudomonas putida DOT-T1E]